MSFRASPCSPIPRTIALLGLALLLGCANTVTLDDGDAGSEDNLMMSNAGQPPSGFPYRVRIPVETTPIGVAGIDILLVVDDAMNRWEPRNQLATELYVLLSGLIHPVGDPKGAAEVRVAMTSPDLGLQYGGGQMVSSSSQAPPPDRRRLFCVRRRRPLPADGGGIRRHFAGERPHPLR